VRLRLGRGRAATEGQIVGLLRAGADQQETDGGRGDSFDGPRYQLARLASLPSSPRLASSPAGRRSVVRPVIDNLRCPTYDGFKLQERAGCRGS
jgi:hypothetical protein